MSEDEVVRELDGIKRGDVETNHLAADEALIAFLRTHHPRVADAWLAARDRDGGWWYA